MLQKTLKTFLWALPFGPGFPLQVLAPFSRCGLSTAIPNVKNKIKINVEATFICKLR
jgi:hypothetical protein